MKNFTKDVGVFLLFAVVTVSLASFAGGIQTYIKNNNAENQQAQVFDSLSGENVLIAELMISPEGSEQGENMQATWTLNKNAVSCVASSNPESVSWEGSKDSTKGSHFEVITAPKESTSYVIECTASDGKKSLASMAVDIQ